MSIPASAEGSRELTSTGGDRPYLEFRNDDTSGIARRTDVFVYAESGETLYLGSSAAGIGSGTIDLTRPDGTTTSCGSTGRIDNRSEEATGPNTLFTGGYDPCTVSVGTGQTGVWKVEFVSPDPGSNANPTPRSASASWNQPNGVGYVVAWDVTVADGGSEVKGRAWTPSFAGNMGTFDARFASQFFVQTKAGLRFRVDANEIQPFGFIFFANNNGFLDSNGDPLFRSISGTSNLIGNGNLHDPNADDTADDITHKLFFNPPSSDLPETADTPTGSTWLDQPIIDATVSNVSFTGVEGTSGQMGEGMGGTFQFDIDEDVPIALRIDVDQNGSFTNAIDRTLIVDATTGTNTVAWDGLDGNGNPVTAGGVTANLGIELQPLEGSVHFPYIDVENNPNGIIIERENGPGLPDFDINWDDTVFGGGSSGTSVDSSGGAHVWTGDFGDKRGIDTWAFGDNPEEFSISLSVEKADLQVTSKTLSPSSFQIGDTLTATFTVRNDGPSPVSGATVKDELPNQLANLQLVNVTPTGGAASSGESFSGSTFTATADMPDGSTITYEITGTVQSGGELTNKASILRTVDVFDPEATDPDPAPPSDVDDECAASGFPDTCNNIGTASVNTADLEGGKTNDAGGAIQLGETFTWTLTVTNGDPTDVTFNAGETILADDLPAGPTYSGLSQSMSGGVTGPVSCTLSGNAVSCTADGSAVTLPSGASIEVSVDVEPQSTGTLTNAADPLADPNDVVSEVDETNNGGQDAVDVNARPDRDDDGIPDDEEGDGDRDGDGVPNDEDFDPGGYFYCRDTGEILEGGRIEVSGPAPVDITLDGSSGAYNFTVDTAGTYTVVFNAPPNTSVDTSFEQTIAFDPTGRPNPVVLGPGEDGDSGFLTEEPMPFPTDYYTSFELDPADPKVINNNVPLMGEPCQADEPTVGGDPPLWGETLLFPTPETFVGADLNNDGDVQDAVLRIKDLNTGRVRNTGIPVSNHHRAVDLHRDTAVFVTQESGLRDPSGLFNLWGGARTDEGPIGVLDVETGEVEMLDVWGTRPTIHDAIVTISGATLRYYDLAEDRLVNTGHPGKRPAVWGEWIVYERTVDGVPRLHLYNLETGGVQNTGIAGAYPAIHAGTVAFTTDESWMGQDLNGDGDRRDTVVRAYDIDAERVTNTRQAGQNPAIYGDRIAFSQGRSILYHDLSTGRTYDTGQQGAEPDIYRDTITSYVWEDWLGADRSLDGDRDDPIVQTHTASPSDRTLPQPELPTEPETQPLTLRHVQSHRHADGVRFLVRGQGIDRVSVQVFDLSGRTVAHEGTTGTQLTWRLANDNGQRVANGVYLYVVTAYGADGQVTRSDVRKLVVLR